MALFKKIIWVAMIPAWLGAGYFLTLVLHLPFWMLLALLLVLYFLGRKRLKDWIQDNGPDIDARQVTFLAIGLSVIVLMGLSVYKYYGEADARSMWNYYARFLYFEDHWRDLFVDTNLANHNHPVLLPSIIAFFWRITGTYPSWIIPQLMAWLPAILMPVLLMFHFYRRSPWLAFGLLLLLGGNTFYLNMGVNQYADIWVSLYFFISVLCILHWRKEGHPVWLWLWGSALGAAAFTKNEGIMLGMFSILLLHKEWKAKPLPVLAGIFPFAVCIGIHKLMFPVESPVAATWNAEALEVMLDRERIFLILKYLEDNLSGLYSVMTWGLVAVLINSIRLKQQPDTLWWLIILSLAGYSSVYLTLTENGVEWNLATSMVRVLLHVLPAAYLVIASSLLSSVSEHTMPQDN